MTATQIPQTTRLHDKEFAPYISKDTIETDVGRLAAAFAQDYRGKQVRLFCVDQGARHFFNLFTSRLARIDPRLTEDQDSLRVKSYAGTSGGRLRWINKPRKTPDPNIHAVAVEDIVDRGHTMALLEDELGPNPNAKEPRYASFGIVAMLDKRVARDRATPVVVNYPMLEIPNLFVVGSGLDYDERGRELPGVLALYEPGVTSLPYPAPRQGSIHSPF